MKFAVKVRLPVEPFNDFVREGTAGEKIQQILEATQPEAVYFWEEDGMRGGVLIHEIESASQIPSIAEPWFLTFEAEVMFHPCMTPEDLAQADLADLGRQFG